MDDSTAVAEELRNLIYLHTFRKVLRKVFGGKGPRCVWLTPYESEKAIMCAERERELQSKPGKMLTSHKGYAGVPTSTHYFYS